jgi:hypothetical protein
VLGVGGEFERVDPGIECRDAVQAVVGFRVEVDDQRPAPLGGEGDRLRGDRLARAERAGPPTPGEYPM